jgi:hypothetical protein
MPTARPFGGIVRIRRGLGSLLALATFAISSAANAVVQFAITNPGGQSLPGQTVTVFPPDGGDPFEASDDDNDGIIILPNAEGPGWVARYSVNGQMMSATGQVVTATMASTTGGAAAAAGNTMWGVVAGIGLITAGAIANGDSSDSTPVSDTGTGGGTTSGDTTGGDTTGGDTTGGTPGTDLSCDAVVNITASEIVNPGGFTDAPNLGDMTRVILQGTTTVIFEIDVPNLAVDATLTCTSIFEDPVFVGDYSANDCSGSASGTFNGQPATISFTSGFASVVFDSGLGQNFLIAGGADMDVLGLASPYSTSFIQWCP